MTTQEKINKIKSFYKNYSTEMFFYDNKVIVFFEGPEGRIQEEYYISWNFDNLNRFSAIGNWRQIGAYEEASKIGIRV